MTKPQLIVIKVIYWHLFTDLGRPTLDNYRRTYLLNQIEMLDRDLQLELKKDNVLEAMLSSGLIHQTGTYRGEPIYSTYKPTTQKIIN